jgi:5-methyltetrahydrofolate--homocysteine methyltransferase
MTQREDRIKLLYEAAAERILVKEGPHGSYLLAHGLTLEDYGGQQYEGCPEQLNRTRPDVIRDMHRQYLAAGADLVMTNTFGGMGIVLAEYGLHSQVRDVAAAAVRIAREAVEEFSTPSRPRWVMGDMGPTTKAISVTGGITFDELIATFYELALALGEAGADTLLLETQNDTRTIKAGLIGIWRAFDELGFRLPVMVSGTIEQTGTMLAGQSAEALAASVMHAELFSLGLNCSTGPEFMTDHLRGLADISEFRLGCWPNAGLPDAEGTYCETPEQIATVLERFADHGWLNVTGGCCGTTAEHIRAIAQMVEGKQPRVPQKHRRLLFSGIDFLEATEDNRPLIVGERTNEVGSRKFKRLITQEKYEEATEIARQQVKGGAQIIDVNLQNADRDEIKDIDRFYELLNKKIRVPIMVDTTDPTSVERSLQYCQGKSIINSINLEDGLEKFERVVPIAKTYGAALIVGCIDEDKEQAQAITRQRKLEIALRSWKLLTEDFGVRPGDIIFDPLVFPCATGDQNYVGSAVETIEGIRLIKDALPDARTVLGISNVSFGLPEAGREVLNSVFLYHCTKARLDLAIVQPEKLERYASIPEEERRLAEDLLWNRGDDPVAAFAAHFRGAESRVKKDVSSLPLDERLANYIIEGTKDGLIDDLERKRAEGATPLEIINGPLMAGMDEVGRLFNANELIVAEVLQSAEAMKAAVSHLEQYMEKSESSSRGKVILATVKGDVHDIGKNLVDIILSNNGYTVVNLGIKVPPEQLIEAVQEHHPDAIGLSGLLVKSAQQMVVTATDLRDANVSLPVLVGGAALSNKFTRTRIAPEYEGTVVYCNDAMNGLDTLNRLMDPEARRQLEASLLEHDGAQASRAREEELPPETETRSSRISLDVPIPPVPDTERHVIEITGVPKTVTWAAPAGSAFAERVSLDTVWSYVNPQMLFGKHLGFRGRFTEALESGDVKAQELVDRIEEVKAECRAGAMKVAAIWRFFEAEPAGNRLHLFEQGAREPAATFAFPRQRKPDGVSLPDLVLPPTDGTRDHVALFVTTAGAGINALADEAKRRGEYVRSYALQALALETAEAAAEWLHSRLRGLWGFPDGEVPRKDLFQAHYRGKRYSFGYPACPDLEQQDTLFRLLRPEDAGVSLTDGFMMEPEASVSALVFHHPDAAYFSVGRDGEPN